MPPCPCEGVAPTASPPFSRRGAARAAGDEVVSARSRGGVRLDRQARLRRIVDLIWNLRLDELRKQGQRFLPAEIASLGWDDGRHAFLDDAHLRADGYLLEGDRRLHFAGQVRIVELVGIANTLVRRQHEIAPAQRLA